MSPWILNRYARAIARGAVFAYPTDTIWGFGCHPLVVAGVVRILAIKRRPAAKGLILLTSRLDYVVPFVAVDAAIRDALARPAAQPTTYLVPASADCPSWLTGTHPTLAVRVTDHPLIERLCDAIEAPLVSTSANRAGGPTVRNYLQARRRFGAELDFVIPGYAAGSGRPSTIKSLADGAIIRGGA